MQTSPISFVPRATKEIGDVCAQAMRGCAAGQGYGLCLCPKTGYIIWHEFALNRVKFCVSVLIIHRVFEQ